MHRRRPVVRPAAAPAEPRAAVLVVPRATVRRAAVPRAAARRAAVPRAAATKTPTRRSWTWNPRKERINQCWTPKSGSKPKPRTTVCRVPSCDSYRRSGCSRVAGEQWLFVKLLVLVQFNLKFTRTCIFNVHVYKVQTHVYRYLVLLTRYRYCTSFYGQQVTMSTLLKNKSFINKN